jgi:hypothetical protein
VDRHDVLGATGRLRPVSSTLDGPKTLVEDAIVSGISPTEPVPCPNLQRFGDSAPLSFVA